MAVDTLEAKAHQLLGQLNPGKLAAVVHLLEVMVHDEDDEEELTEEDRRAIAASRDYFRQGGQGLSFEQVAAECGFTMDQIRGRPRQAAQRRV
jgi:hypothetical protein